MEDYKNKIYKALQYRDFHRETPLEIYRRNKAEKEYAENVAQANNIINNGFDDYFHRKTVYEAAQQNIIDGANMMLLGELKEIADRRKYTKKYGREYADRESEKDLQNNKIGFILGLGSKDRAEDNPEFNRYNTASMNLLLDALKANK